MRGSWLLKKGQRSSRIWTLWPKTSEKFSKPERKKLLAGLAIELQRRQDLEEASRLYTRLAEEDPTNIQLRLTLLDIAFQIDNKGEFDNKAEIEKNIKQIKAIEANDGVQGLYCQVQYLLWQAKRAGDKAVREAIHLQVRSILSELLTPAAIGR